MTAEDTGKQPSLEVVVDPSSSGLSFSNGMTARRIRLWTRKVSGGFSWPLLIVVLGSLGFVASMFWLSWLKYYTFNASVLDLGLSNQIYWLFSHGGIAEYQQSGLISSYPVQYEESMYFVIAPFYGLAPGIPFLLGLQSGAIGLSAIPLYFLARRKLQAEWLPVLVAGIYLTFFTLASATLFDYHNESLFPILFFSAVLAHETRHKVWFYVFGLLAALIDPLTLLVVVFFTLTTYVPMGGQSVSSKLSSAASAVKARPSEMVFTVGLGLLFVFYYLSGTLFPTLTGNVGPSGGLVSILFFSINDKVNLLLFMFGALAFLPLFEWRTTFVMLPYLGFVFFSTAPGHWSAFGNQYPLIGTCPLFYGLILSIASLSPGAHRQDDNQLSHTPANPRGTGGSARSLRRARDQSLWKSRPIKALVLVSVVFIIVYFPFSPANQYVSGGYFNGNANLPGITTVTPAVQFLWDAIHLIPPGASVLTQNNIPQLSGREYFQTPTTYNPQIPYNYILLDTELTYFAETNQLMPFVDAALTNGTFGILAEGSGALLLERGYTGTIELFEPTVYSYLGNQMLPYAATVEGTSLVGNTSAGWMWYGPYVQLLPGNYSVSFNLSSNLTVPSNARAITLDVDSHGGSDVYAQESVYLGNFTSPGEPTRFELSFMIPQITSNVEFRGVMPTGAATLTLWNITATSLI